MWKFITVELPPSRRITVLCQLQGLPATETSPSGAWEMAATVYWFVHKHILNFCYVLISDDNLGLERAVE